MPQKPNPREGSRPQKIAPAQPREVTAQPRQPQPATSREPTPFERRQAEIAGQQIERLEAEVASLKAQLAAKAPANPELGDAPERESAPVAVPEAPQG